MLKKILVPTLVISGTIFTIFGVFVATQRERLVEIRIGEQQVYYGELRDLVSPQIGAGIALSLGLTSALVMGWVDSIRKTSQLEQRLASLQKQIAEKEAEINEFKLSPSNPDLSQLSWFFDDLRPVGEESLPEDVATIFDSPDIEYASTEQTVPAPSSWAQLPILEVEPVVIQSLEPQTPAKTTKKPVQTATSMFLAAQSVIGLTHKN